MKHYLMCFTTIKRRIEAKMKENHYQALIERLYNVNLFDGVKLGLTNMLALNEELDFPTLKFKTIHIAGSNGKGSVSTKIAKVLELSGRKVGLFTSPHISCFRERIQINGEMISEADVVTHLSKLFEIKELKKIPCTFFELTTMVALIYFAASKIDIAVIETGLGGRLDATNIITPTLSIITSISKDHTDILGDTIEQITTEKAGIIKPKIPVIIGPKVPFEIVEAFAIKNKSLLTQVKGHYIHFDDENSAIAKKALISLNIAAEFIENGLRFKPPCRMEIFEYQGKTLILDVAHNPDGLKQLFISIKEKYPEQNLRIIFGLSQNKDIEACLSVLKKISKSFHIVAAKNGRAAPVQELRNRLPSKPDVLTHESVEEAIHKALTFNDIIVICGTFFIMSEARFALGMKNPSDFTDMNEKMSFPSKPNELP